MVISNPRDLHLEGNVRLCLIPVPTFADIVCRQPSPAKGLLGAEVKVQ